MILFGIYYLLGRNLTDNLSSFLLHQLKYNFKPIFIGNYYYQINKIQTSMINNLVLINQKMHNF